MSTEEQIFITVRSLQSIQFNILNHVLVPKHRVLSEKEFRSEKREEFKILQDRWFINKEKSTEIFNFDAVNIARVQSIPHITFARITLNLKMQRI